MHIAGGLYHELCETPTWNAQFGSGGRAAAAVSVLSPRSTLHTYTVNDSSPGSDVLTALGVQISSTPSDTAIVFAYFHPLSQPHIEPRPEAISQQPPIQVSADVVLRFGFLEGSAIVHASNAIYDPQTALRPEPFGANGSTAKRLALVMNELELCRYTGCADITTAAAKVISSGEQETVIVVKRGVRGVAIYEHNAEPAIVPAYYSSRVFKIGTGDVFSAVFAHYWGEVGTSAVEAADIASRSVSAYCETMILPVRTELLDMREPVTGQTSNLVVLHGSTLTIGRRYTLEEARFCLQELGIEALSPQLDKIPNSLLTNASLLVVADGISPLEIRQISAICPYESITILDEEQRSDIAELSDTGATIIPDFASSLYRAVWPRTSRRVLPVAATYEI